MTRGSYISGAVMVAAFAGLAWWTVYSTSPPKAPSPERPYVNECDKACQRGIAESFHPRGLDPRLKPDSTMRTPVPKPRPKPTKQRRKDHGWDI